MAEKTTMVTFNNDVAPYCFGDVVKLTDEELKRVNKEARRRGLEDPYTKGEIRPDSSRIVTPTGDSDAELARARATEDLGEDGEGGKEPATDATKSEVKPEKVEKTTPAKADPKATDATKSASNPDAKPSK